MRRPSRIFSAVTVALMVLGSALESPFLIGLAVGAGVGFLAALVMVVMDLNRRWFW